MAGLGSSTSLAQLGDAYRSFLRAVPGGAALADLQEALLSPLGLAPNVAIQSCEWLPQHGDPVRAQWVRQIRDAIRNVNQMPVVVLPARELIPSGLMRELTKGISLPSGAGATHLPSVFNENFHLYIKGLVNEAVGDDVGQCLVSPLTEQFSTIVQTIPGNKELAPIPHCDDGAAVVAIWSFDAPTIFETAQHYLARGQNKNAPKVSQMRAVSRPGDITLHLGTGFEDFREPVYHCSPAANGLKRTVAITSVTFPDRIREAREGLKRMIAGNDPNAAKLFELFSSFL